MNFKANHPEWTPDAQGSQFIKTVNNKRGSAFTDVQASEFNQYRGKFGNFHQMDTRESIILDSFIKGESDYRPETVAREFVALLVTRYLTFKDGIFEANRRNHI